MKLTAFLLLTAAIHVSARSIAQKVTYTANAAPVEKLFAVIKEQTGYFFFYRDEDLHDTRPVACRWKEEPLLSVLNQLFKDQPLTFGIQGTTIVVGKPEKSGLLLPRIDTIPIPASIHGRIVDSMGTPLAGASVTIKGSKKGTATDADGGFNLSEAGNNSILIISFTGFATREYKLHGLQDPVILMSRSVSPLDEVQIIAYGTTTERMNVGSVSTVRSEDIERQPVADVLQALEANVPGLNITQNSGLPGSGYATIQIRGVNSINSGSSPLFIIDGVQVTGIDEFNYGLDPFSSISPTDIESVSVLKDADATAIYGSRGANGVILITTKKGKAGDTKVTATLSSGFNHYAHGSKLLNTGQYLEMRNEAFKNDGVIPDANTAPDLTGYGVNSDPHRYTDWQKALIGNTGHLTDAQLSVSGGSKYTTFAIGASFHRESPTMPAPFYFQRPAVHFNIGHSSNDQRFTISLSGSYSVSNSNFGEEDVTYYTATLPPNLPALTNPDGSYNFYYQYTNPYALMAEPTRVSNKVLIASGSLSYRLLPGLTLKSSFGYTDINKDRTSLAPMSTLPPSYGYTSGYGSFNFSSVSSWQIEPQLEYIQRIGGGKLTALVGGTYQGMITQSHLIYATDYSNDNLEDYSGASNLNVYPDYSNYKYAAIFARLNYNLHDKYLLNLTGRRDGSSRFGPGRQFGNFGAVGAGWVFSQEKFSRDALPWLSFGKLRASYGITGNDQIGDYQYLDTYSATVLPTSYGGTFFGGQYAGQSTVSPTALFNPNYGWETTRKLEIGLDLGLLRDRILLYSSWYRNRSSSQLINYSLPPTTGFPGILENLPATIGNQGWEFTLNTVNVRQKDFSWTSSFNLTIPKNKLLAFPNLATSSYSNTYVIGQPLSIRRVYKYLGVDPHSGLYTFADKDGKTTSNPTPIIDQTALVNTDRRFYGGLSNTLRYHGLQLVIDLQYIKQKNYDISVTAQPAGATGNFVTKVLSRWQKDDDVTNIQKFTQDYGSDAYTAGIAAASSERAYIDASFIRVKNVALSYDFGKHITDRIHGKGLRLYVNAQNLFTFTHYVGNDPETGGLGFLPPMRSIIAGIQCTL